MKVLIATVIVCMMFQSYLTVTCAAANYCMGCNQSTADACTSCFNWASGSVGARALNATANDCKTAYTAPKVTDAQYYVGTTATTVTANSASSGFNYVLRCNKKYLNYAQSTGVTTCSSTAATSCTAIANCDQSSCWTDTSSTVTSGCRICKSGYATTLTANLKPGASACASGATITNCEIMGAIGSTTSATSYCYTCKSKYAVNSAASACTSFTTDSNCRQLGSGGTTCQQCWHSYYWNATTCKLAANLMGVAFIAFAAFFFN